jgi:cytochrome c oxidase cbb3-type subunit 3
MANDNTTGHVWDETLQELNNPLPRWWMGLFVITIVFAVLYLFLYPGLGTNQGSLNWTSKGQWEAEQAKAAATMAPVYAKYTSMPVEAIAADSQAMGIGERLFVNNCAGCHGSNAKGSKSFPNLTDGDWLGGTGHEYIMDTIAKGRQGNMPPMAAAVGTPEDVKNVANYVLSLSGSGHNAIAAQLGKAKFGACAACHGADGKGNHALGAPNLTDKIWLHGFGEEMIVGMINNGKVNVMPQHATRLTPEQIRVLGAYVWGLSNKAANKTAMNDAK